MWSMLWPLGLIILSNTLYNICTKSTPAGVNAFLSLFVTYVIAAIITLSMFFLGGNSGTLVSQLKQLNWTTPVLALTLVGLEFGYICVYRAGWKVTTCSRVQTVLGPKRSVETPLVTPFSTAHRMAS